MSRFVGRVVSAAMDKSAVVVVERATMHPRYRKTVRSTSKLMAHDESNAVKVGDKVEIQECPPISKRKAFRVVEVLEPFVEGKTALPAFQAQLRSKVAAQKKRR